MFPQKFLELFPYSYSKCMPCVKFHFVTLNIIKKAVFLEFYCLLSIYFWGRVFDNLGGAGEQIKILGHLFTPAIWRKSFYSTLFESFY